MKTKSTPASESRSIQKPSGRVYKSRPVLKRLALLLLMALALQFANAQYCANSVLNLQMSDNSMMRVFLDGRPATYSGNVVQFTGIAPGKHFLQVYQVDNSYGYEVLDNAARGYITINDNTEIFATVYGTNQQVVIDRVDPIFVRNSTSRPNTTGICFYPVKPRMTNTGSTCTTTGGATTCTLPVAVPQGPQPMNPMSFGQLKQTVSNSTFESTKLSVFKQALAYNYFTSQQVLDIMNLFTFESYKVEVAKISYAKTLDPNNYYLVNNGFTFSSSVNELNNYIAMR